MWVRTGPGNTSGILQRLDAAAESPPSGSFRVSFAASQSNCPEMSCRRTGSYAVNVWVQAVVLMSLLAQIACAQNTMQIDQASIPEYFVAWPKGSEAAVFRCAQQIGTLKQSWLFRAQDVQPGWLSLDFIVRNNPYGPGAFVKLEETTLWPEDSERRPDGSVSLDHVRSLLKNHGYIEGIALRAIASDQLELRITEDLDGPRTIRYSRAALDAFRKKVSAEK